MTRFFEAADEVMEPVGADKRFFGRRAIEDVTKAEWNEDLHPRDRGKFAPKGGGRESEASATEQNPGFAEALAAADATVGRDPELGQGTFVGSGSKSVFAYMRDDAGSMVAVGTKYNRLADIPDELMDAAYASEALRIGKPIMAEGSGRLYSDLQARLVRHGIANPDVTEDGIPILRIKQKDQWGAEPYPDEERFAMKYQEVKKPSAPETERVADRVELARGEQKFRSEQADLPEYVDDVTEMLNRIQMDPDQPSLGEVNAMVAASWKNGVDDEDAIAGKILAGKATDAELQDYADHVTRKAEEQAQESEEPVTQNPVTVTPQLAIDHAFAEYAGTQASLEGRGIDREMLYRGVSGDQANEIMDQIAAGASRVSFSTRALTSFSTSSEAANKFGPVVVGVMMPRERIFSSYKVASSFRAGGDFAQEEQEVIVWNPDDDIEVKADAVLISSSDMDEIRRDRGLMVAKAVGDKVFIDDPVNANWLRRIDWSKGVVEAAFGKAEWNEELHPRAEHGRFGDKPGGGQPAREVPDPSLGRSPSFGDLARAETGKPMKVTLFRGVASPEEARGNRVPSQFGVGEYWTPSENVARSYGNVRRKEVELRNPKVVDLGDQPWYVAMRRELGTSLPEEVSAKLVAEGHDALVVRDVSVNRFAGGEGVSARNSIEVVMLPGSEADGEKASVDPEADHDGDGVTDAARVGAAGKDVPPPPPIRRLGNLTPQEWRVQQRFAEVVEQDPEGMADRYRSMVAEAARKLGTAPTFSTDDAKLLSPDYAVSQESKARYNVVVHNAANAVAKRAFEDYLDVLKDGPEEKRTILVTAGGVSAGKGYALGNFPETKALQNVVGAVWDSAGEQNSTELPWVMEQAARRGIKPIFAYVDADPGSTFGRVVSRAKKEGRMVDATLFADSYAIGGRNFKAFFEKNKDRATFMFFNNRGDKPSREDNFPEEATSHKSADILSKVKEQIEAASLPEHVRAGAMIGERVFRGV